MNASPLTEGIVFAIDVLLLNNDDAPAEYLVRSCGITVADPADRAVIHKMKAEQSIRPKTIAFIRKHGAKATVAARRKVVAR